MALQIRKSDMLPAVLPLNRNTVLKQLLNKVVAADCNRFHLQKRHGYLQHKALYLPRTRLFQKLVLFFAPAGHVSPEFSLEGFALLANRQPFPAAKLIGILLGIL